MGIDMLQELQNAAGDILTLTSESIEAYIRVG